MGKKLSATAVNSAAKKAYALKEFHLEDVMGEVWDVEIDTRMNPNYVVDMAQNIITLTALLSQEGEVDNFDLEKHWTLLYFIEVLRYYTSVEIKPKKTATETLSAYINLMNNLNSLGLVEKITNCFDEDARQNTFKVFSEVLVEMSGFVTNEINKAVAEHNEAEVFEVEDAVEPTEEVE